MIKILPKIKKTFSFESNNTKYTDELFPYLISLFICMLSYSAAYYFELYTKTLVSIILVVVFVIFFWQTIILLPRLYAVKINKIDCKFLDGKYIFESEKTYIDYRILKKILKNTLGGFKLYCGSIEGKTHIIKVSVLWYKRKNKTERKYYFDREECDFGRMLMLLNENKLINNFKIEIIGTNAYKIENSEVIKILIERYN